MTIRPTAFDPFLGEYHIRVGRQCGLDLVKMRGIGAGIKVNGHKISGRGQAGGLRDDCVCVFMTQQNERNSCH